jgi:hypothetical protein
METTELCPVCWLINDEHCEECHTEAREVLEPTDEGHHEA